MAGGHVDLDESERHATVRRAYLLLAAGGNPRRELGLHERAVTAVADDLDSETARSQLRSGLVDLEPETAQLTNTNAAREQLLADPDLAWQCFARALLLDALAE